MTESFTGTSDTVGPDLAWERQVSALGAAAVVLGGSSNQSGVALSAALASDPPLVVRNGVLTLEAPDLSLLPGSVTGPNGYWSRLTGTAVTAEELGSLDMTTSVVIAAAPPLGTTDGDSMLFGGVELYARVDGDPANGINDDGWWNFTYVNQVREIIGVFAAGGGGPDPAESDPQGVAGLTLAFPAAGGLDFATYDSELLGLPLFQAGDTLSLTVTGTGAATRVTARLNGTTVFFLDGIDFDEWESPPDDPHDLDTELPAQSHGAIELTAAASDVDTGPGNWHGPWNPGDLDEAFAVDDFQMCPA